MTGQQRPIRRSKLATKRTVYLLILTFASIGVLYRTAAPLLRDIELFDKTPGDSEPLSTAETHVVELVKVVDGDTLKVRRGGIDEYVRLLRIDTPERGEPGHGEATAALAALVDGQRLVLEPEPGHDFERDKYGRLLAYVRAGKRNVSLAMVESGWTAFYTRFGQGRYAAQFRAAELQAKAERRGLWAPDFATGD